MSSSGMETASRASARVTHLRPSLFPGGVGKTWKEGDFEKLLGDVTSRVFNVYGDSTVVYPGHGDDTTLGTERPHLAEWQQRGW
jgi:glyoxylase-like metal-dependent hydrolase (beta-lactamase superfamily II)